MPSNRSFLSSQSGTMMSKGHLSLFGKVRFLAKLLLPGSRLFALGVFVSLLLTQVITVIFSVLPQHIVQLVQSHAPGTLPCFFFTLPLPSDLLLLALLFVTVGIASLLLSFLSSMAERRLQNHFAAKLRKAVHDKLLTLDATYHDRHNIGEHLVSLNHAVSVSVLLVTLLIFPATCILTATLGLQNLSGYLRTGQAPTWLIATIFVAMLLAPLVRMYLGRKIAQANETLQAGFREFNAEAFNSLKAPIEVQLLNAVKARMTAFARACARLSSAFNRLNAHSIVNDQFNAFCILVFQVFVVFVVVRNANAATAASLIGCILIIPQVFNQLNTLFSTYTQYKQSSPEVESTYRLLTLQPTTCDAADARDVTFERAPKIACEGVTFGYLPTDPILKAVSLELPAGKTIAIVSHSGGGKSTLLKLLNRVYDPTSGTIRLDGDDVKQLSLASLRKTIAQVSQFPLFILGTVRENFQLQKMDVTDADIEAVCRNVGIWETLQALAPNSPCDAQLTLGAENLSGGQRRLLALARMMLHDPKVLIVDEPTTGVDAQAVQQTILPILTQCKRERTVLLVDHNMNFVRALADYVLVLEQGQVADFAETEKVWAKETSLFRRLWEEFNKHQAPFANGL